MMMMPLNAQGLSLGTHRGSTGPCESTTQQAPGTRPLLNRHHCCRRCPPAGSSEGFSGDAPPPYHSLPPLASITTGCTNTESRSRTARSGRRNQSESCVSPYHHRDNDFLANLAAIQLLSGCMADPIRQIGGIHRCSGVACSHSIDHPDNLKLHAVSKTALQHQIGSSTVPYGDATPIHTNTDGHMSLESTNPVRVWARPRSTPTTLSFSHEHCPSEDLDRRLESINHALRRDGLQPRKPNKRLHTSEVSRKEQSHTADDAVETGQSFRDYNCNKSGESSVKSTPRGILGALRNFQHKDSSRGMNDHSPSPAFSHTPSSYEAPSEVRRPMLPSIAVLTNNKTRWRLKDLP